MSKDGRGAGMADLAPGISPDVSNLGDARGRSPVPAVAVLLCQGLQALELEELRRWLENRHGDVQVKVVPDLCHTAGEVRSCGDAGVCHIVLGLCSLEYGEIEVQYQARKAGLDPLGIEAVDLGGFCSPVREGPSGTEKAKLLLMAAVAKVRAYPGSGPENVKPCLAPLSQKVGRRALFTLPPLRYQMVASIDGERCVDETECNLCIQACPTGALNNTDGPLQVDKIRCDGCGLCVAACPSDAIQFPGCSPAELEAQIGALLETGSVALPERRILFTCRRSATAIEKLGKDGVGASPSWLPVQVPCAGMVPVSCILGCVAGGVTVGLVSCGEPCPFGQHEAVKGRIDYCRALLERLGGPPGRVRLVSPEDAPEQEDRTDGVKANGPGGKSNGVSRAPLFGPGAIGESLRRLKSAHDADGDLASDLTLEDHWSPVGVVVVETGRCTGCGMCAGSCPTGALKFARDGDGVELTFDAGLCVACEQCIPVCPEAAAGAIRVVRTTDFDRIERGRETLYRESEALCEACGAPVAPVSMLNRIASLMGGEEAFAAAKIGRYCLSCRGSPRGDHAFYTP